MAASETSATSRSVAAGNPLPRTSAPRVSVVVPAFNEAARIGESVRRIEKFLSQASFSSELIVVDDGSVDDTSAIVKGAEFPGLQLIRHSENHGKGYAVTTGVLASTGDYVLFSDADLSSPIEEMGKLLDVAVRTNADIVVGSRALDRSLIEKHQSRTREVGGIVFNKLVRFMLGLNIHDTQCGFKLFRRDAVVPIFRKLTTWGFGFDPELLFVAARFGLAIVEVPVRWSHSEGSKIRFASDGTRMFADLVRIRWNYMAGRYS